MVRGTAPCALRRRLRVSTRPVVAASDEAMGGACGRGAGWQATGKLVSRNGQLGLWRRVAAVRGEAWVEDPPGEKRRERLRPGKRRIF